jgi:hypothetical protein
MKNLLLLIALILSTSITLSAQRRGGGHRHGGGGSIQITVGGHYGNGGHQGNGHHHGNNGHHHHGNNGHHHGGGYHTNNGGSCNNWTPCCASDFNYVYNAIDAQCFASDRLRVGKRLIRRYRFSNGQIRRLINLFTYESDRLAFAKCAYAYSCNRGRYADLYDCFTYRSSVRELNRYISGY